jgi:hypothetical protein
MQLKKTVLILAVGALVAAVAFGVIVYRSVRAQEATPTPASSGGRGRLLMDQRGFGRDFGGYGNEDLAAALGISVDELKAAYEKANKAALAQAVEAGLITQAQADELSAGGAAFPFGGRWAGWLSQKGIDYQALLAEALGITTDQLQAAYAQAHNARIDQALADGQITQEQADLMKGQYALANNQDFRSAMQSAFATAVQQAVNAGVITQAQADQILQKMNGGFFPGGPGFGPGGPGGFHDGGGFGRHGRGGDAPFGPGTPAEPTEPQAEPSNGL